MAGEIIANSEDQQVVKFTGRYIMQKNGNKITLKS